MAILDTLTIENYGPFAQVTLPLSPLSVIVGPNASGKTTVLNAVRALAALSDADWPRHAPTTKRRLGSVRGIRLQIGARSEGSSMSVGFQAPEMTWRDRYVQLTIDGTTITSADGQAKSAFKDRSIETTGGDPDVAIVTGTLSTSVSASRPEVDRLSRVHRLLDRVALFKPDAAAMRQPSPAFPARRWPGDGRGFGLATTIVQIAAKAPRQAVAMLDLFLANAPGISNYEVIPTQLDEGVPSYKLVFTVNTGEQLTPDEVSDGTMLLLGFLAMVHQPTPPSVLLVEEPENGMHPARIREVLTLLRKLSTGELGGEPTQVIATTHMPYLLDEVAPEEAFFCHRDGDGIAHCVRFSDVPGVKEELAYKLLGELWAEHGEARLFERWKGRQAAK